MKQKRQFKFEKEVISKLQMQKLQGGNPKMVSEMCPSAVCPSELCPSNLCPSDLCNEGPVWYLEKCEN